MTGDDMVRYLWTFLVVSVGSVVLYLGASIIWRMIRTAFGKKAKTGNQRALDGGLHGESE